LPGADYVDAFEAPLDRADAPMIEVYKAIRTRPPRIVSSMMRLRNLLVAPFGLKGGDLRVRAPIDARRPLEIGDVVGGWRLYGLEADELLVGLDDKHLDFRVSFRRRAHADGPSIVVATAVKTHNALGRTYLRLILPFHRRFVRLMLDEASKAGRI
jgi:hypothetical protein